MVNYLDEYIQDLITVQNDTPNFSKLYNKNILVTGSSGLICSAIVDALMEYNSQNSQTINIFAAGRNVKKLEARFEQWKESPYLHLVQYNAEKPIVFNDDYDFIIHGASNANPSNYAEQPVETMLSNLYGTDNLLKYIVKQQHGRLLYISSSEVYGNRISAEPYKENEYFNVDILNARSCYPSSKRAAETLCASYQAEYHTDFVIVRPGHVYGPTMTAQDNRASSYFPKCVISGKDITMKSAGTQMRSYCYVLDCVSAILTVLLNGKSGEAYNISNKKSVVSIREMAEAFALVSGRKIICSDPTTKEKLSYNMMNNSILSSEKLESLGWTGRYDMFSGAKKTVKLYQ